MRPVALLLAVALVWTPAQPLLAQAVTRIVAIGDIHGEIDGFKSILKAAGLTDATGRGSGGRTQLIQTGDYTDRGTGTRAVHGSADGARAAGQERRRPRLRAARQSRGDEPDRRHARCDARDLRHLRHCQFREAPPRRVGGLREARRRQDREGRAGARRLLADPRGVAHHAPARLRRIPRRVRATRQVRRLAARQADRHRGRRQHLHARRHLAGDGAGEDRGAQRPRPRRDPPARSLPRSAGRPEARDAARSA